MSYSNILLEKKDGVAKIILNRPDALNALDGQTMNELREAFEEIGRDESLRVVTLTGAGRAFCAGADLKYVRGVMDDPIKAYSFLRQVHSTFNLIEGFSLPVIAGIHGFVLAGGLELVMACDIIIASEDAKIGDQHANFGLVPGGGGTQRLPRIIGPMRAKEVILTGRWLTAQEAKEMGLVNQVVAPQDLQKAVDEMAQNLRGKSPVASRTIKHLVNKGLETDLVTALHLEIAEVANHFSTQDVREGIAAFVEKRKPAFKGK